MIEKEREWCKIRRHLVKRKIHFTSKRFVLRSFYEVNFCSFNVREGKFFFQFSEIALFFHKELFSWLFLLIEKMSPFLTLATVLKKKLPIIEFKSFISVCF